MAEEFSIGERAVVMLANEIFRQEPTAERLEELTLRFSSDFSDAAALLDYVAGVVARYFAVKQVRY